jgi:predicted HAD superfamily phosphohydrolase
VDRRFVVKITDPQTFRVKIFDDIYAVDEAQAEKLVQDLFKRWKVTEVREIIDEIQI